MSSIKSTRSPVRQFSASVMVIFIVVAAASPAAAQQVTIKTSDGQGLDMIAQEIADPGNGYMTNVGTNNGSAGGFQLSVRYNGFNGGLPPGDTGAGSDSDTDTQNTMAVFRFDLSAVDKSMITNPELLFINYRPGSNNARELRLWGINGGQANLNTFTETSPYTDLPGFDAPDGNILTQGVSTSNATFLGDFRFLQDTSVDPPVDFGEGHTNILNQELLDTTGFGGMNGMSAIGPTSPVDGGVAVQNTLQGFLRSLGPTDMAVFIIGGISSNGVQQIMTDEATQSAGNPTLGVPPVLMGNAGDFAPALRFSTGVAGNANFDGQNGVNGNDFLIWQKGVGLTGEQATLAAGNANGDTIIDSADLTVWKGQYGPSAIANVPEPGTLGLLTVASVVVGALRRRSASTPRRPSARLSDRFSTPDETTGH